MPENDQPNANQNVQTKKQKKSLSITSIIVAALIFLAVLGAVAYFFVNEHSARINFVTVHALSFLVVVIIAIQTYIYRRQWEVMEDQGKAMQDGLKQTDRVIEKMQGQLDAIDKQAGIMVGQKEVMERQLTVMTSQANLFIESIDETRKIGVHNQQMVEAMKDQVKIMGDSLVETRRLQAVGEYQAEIAALNVKVSERNATAAERSVEVMKESYIATTRAYIGIREIWVGALIVKQIPTLSVVWHNGGNTPASHFRANVYLVFGEKPERGGYRIDDDWSDSKASFLPPGVSNPVHYPQVQVGFKPVTKEMLDELNGGSKRLYAMIEGIYVDFSDQPRTFKTSYIYNPWEGSFTELYEYQTENQDAK